MRHVLALALLLAAAAASAQDDPAGAPPGSALATLESFGNTLAALDADLAVASKHLSAGVLGSGDRPGNGSVASSLDAEAAAWRDYREAVCGLVGAMTGAGGLWPAAWATECAAERTRARLALVREASRCTEALTDGERRADVGQCLGALGRDPAASPPE